MIPRSILSAQKLTSELFIQNPNDLDLEGVINLYGSYYQEKAMSGADGRIIFKGNNTIITINSNISYLPKKRFVIAHEFGHLILHKSTLPVFSCDEASFMEWYHGSSYEVQANEFASEFLMPTALFISEAKKHKHFDFEVIKSLATHFQTSITSTLIKFITSGTHPVAAVYSINGKVKWQSFGSDFIFKRFKSKKNLQIPTGTVASDILKEKATAMKKEMVPAFYWFEIFDSQREIYLYEQCFQIQSQNGLISLLWVCEDY